MIPLITKYRTAQLFAHNAHHLTTGATFFSDHEYLGELYAAYESAYDVLVERWIGLGNVPNLMQVQRAAADNVTAVRGIPAAFAFGELLRQEEGLQKWIENAISVNSPPLTQGTINLLTGLADESEARVYKLKQRLL